MPGPEGEPRIPNQLRHALQALPDYTVFDDLAFRVAGSIVTLEGAVTNPVLKSAAERVARKIEGVTQVINEMRVLPPPGPPNSVSWMDDVIRGGEWSALTTDPEIGPGLAHRSMPSVHIIVENAHITIEGFVASEREKDLITDRVNAEAKFLSGNPPYQIPIPVQNDLTVMDTAH